MVILAGALALGLALALPAQTRDADSWITIERAVAEKAGAAFAKAGRPDALVIESEGKVVVARLSEADVSRLSGWVHSELGHCGGFMGHATRDEAFQEAARANREGPADAAPQFNYTIDNPAVVQALMAQITELNVRNTITSLSNFQTRYHNCETGKGSARWIRDLWRGYAQGRTDVSVEPFKHSGYQTMQPSLILTIQGTGLPSEVVVLGGHQDSTIGGGCGRSPGADDDASGIASLSEVIRVAMALGYKPLRTVKFMAYAAEEIGLRGSGQIAATFQQQNVNVVGVLQLDMTGYEGSANDIYLISDNTNAAQNTFVGDLVDTYLTGITRGTTACQYGCSDHASWHSRGYAASFPFEAYFRPFPPNPQYNPFIHTQSDTLANIGNNANHAVKFSKLSAAYMAEMAKGTLP
jgi:leucyl aminopeptidase